MAQHRGGHRERSRHEQPARGEDADHDCGHSEADAPRLRATRPASRFPGEEEHRVDAGGDADHHRQHPAEEGEVEVGVDQRERRRREERPHAVGSQNEAEEQGEGEADEGAGHESGGERPLPEAADAHGGVHEVGGGPESDESGPPQESGPLGDEEVPDHAGDAHCQEQELPATESLAPDRALQDDGDDLVARPHDGEGDPAERHRVREGENPRLVIVPGQLGRQPRQADRGEDERPGGGHEVTQRKEHGRAAPWRSDHGPARGRFLIRMRTTPGSGSSVSWTNPRSSSCGYRNIGRRSWITSSCSSPARVSRRSSTRIIGSGGSSASHVDDQPVRERAGGAGWRRRRGLGGRSRLAIEPHRPVIGGVAFSPVREAPATEDVVEGNGFEGRPEGERLLVAQRLDGGHDAGEGLHTLPDVVADVHEDRAACRERGRARGGGISPGRADDGVPRWLRFSHRAPERSEQVRR